MARLGCAMSRALELRKRSSTSTTPRSTSAPWPRWGCPRTRVYPPTSRVLLALTPQIYFRAQRARRSPDHPDQSMPRCLVLVACLVAGAASFAAAPAIVVQRLPRKPPSRKPAVPRVCATAAEEQLDERLPPVGQQLQLFWRLSKPFFEQCEGAKLALALLVGLTLLNSGVAVLFSYAS